MDIRNLNEERKKRNLSVAELAEKANLPKGTIEKILFGIVKNPRLDTVQAIERALCVDTSSRIEKDPVIQDEVEINDLYPIPLLGSVVAGTPIEQQEDLEGYVFINYMPKEEYFALRVHGESMKNAGIQDKSILIVHKQETAECNDIVVAMLNREQTVKRFKRYSDNIFLMPENPDFEPIPVTPDDEFIILGKVVEVRFAL